MKRLIFVIALFFLSLAGVSATQADEKADYQAALAKYHEGHYDQAVVGFQNILMKDPDSWQAYQGLGDAFLHEGDKSGAFQAYQRSLKLHPDNPTVKAMVNKLFPEPPPPLQPTPAPTAGPRPAATDADKKIETIGTFTDQNGTKHTSNFIFEGKPLENDGQIEDVIDQLKDDQATRLIKSARKQEGGANVLDVLGALSMAGGIVYAVAAPNNSVTNSGPYGGGFVSQTNPDLTPSYIMGGIGVGLVLIGKALDGNASHDRYNAVARYNELAGSESQPDGEKKTAAAESTAKTTLTEAPDQDASQESSSAPATEAGSKESQIGLGFTGLLTLPVSKQASSEYLAGFGFGLDYNLPLNERWSLGLAASYVNMPVNTNFLAQTFQQTYGVSLPAGVSFTGGWNYFPIVAMAKYSIPLEKSQAAPYFFTGGGVAINDVTVSVTYNGQSAQVSTGETDLLLCPGMGINIHMDPKVDLFLQGRLDIVFTSQNNSDVITLTSGGSTTKSNGNLSDESPTLFLPIEMGVRF